MSPQTLPSCPWRSPAHHPLQHRRLRQRLHPSPPADGPGVVSGPLEGHGPQQPRQTQQVLYGPELRLGPLPSAPDSPLPVPVGRGELPPVPFHRALLLPPVPPSSLTLHRLLVTLQQPESPLRVERTRVRSPHPHNRPRLATFTRERTHVPTSSPDRLTHAALCPLVRLKCLVQASYVPLWLFHHSSRPGAFRAAIT